MGNGIHLITLKYHCWPLSIFARMWVFTEHMEREIICMGKAFLISLRKISSFSSWTQTQRPALYMQQTVNSLWPSMTGFRCLKHPNVRLYLERNVEQGEVSFWEPRSTAPDPPTRSPRPSSSATCPPGVKNVSTYRWKTSYRDRHT